MNMQTFTLPLSYSFNLCKITLQTLFHKKKQKTLMQLLFPTLHNSDITTHKKLSVFPFFFLFNAFSPLLSPRKMGGLALQSSMLTSCGGTTRTTALICIYTCTSKRHNTTITFDLQKSPRTQQTAGRIRVKVQVGIRSFSFLDFVTECLASRFIID